MQTLSETVRFEVLVDGQRRCIAGIDGLGVLSIIVNWVMRDPKAKPDDYSIEDWSRQRLQLSVGGLRVPDQQSVNWVSEDLAAAEEITIRVLGPGEFDSPPHRS
jgi:hypothetical protein